MILGAEVSSTRREKQEKISASFGSMVPQERIPSRVPAFLLPSFPAEDRSSPHGVRTSCYASILKPKFFFVNMK